MTSAGRKRKSAPHVLVTIPTANITHRRLLEGILAYAQEHGPWLFHLNTGDIAAQGLHRFDAWGVNGVIALSANSELTDKLSHIRAPKVFINPPSDFHSRSRRCVTVRRDNVNLGRMAAEFLLERGFTSFAFIGSPRASEWSAGRQRGFCGTVESAGMRCAVYPPPSAEECADFSLEAIRLGPWLKSLPPRTALYTVKDIRGQQILATCLDCGIAVPDTLAVLSTDDDRILCETTTPSMSSVALDGKHTGITCAKALDDMMHGKPCSPLINIAFPRIVERRSTDSLAIDDPILSRVVSQIRADLGKRTSIRKIAADIGVSTRTIELKALRHFGHSLREEIRNLRLDRVRSLLHNSDLTTAEIAEQCGFCSPSHLTRATVGQFGHTPGEMRNHIPPPVSRGQPPQVPIVSLS